MMVGVTVAVGGPVSELLVALRSGQVSAREITLAHLAALRALDARTGAIAAFEDERALADADRLDQVLAADGPVGPLHGLPVTVKDWIDVEGFTCAGESARHRDRRPAADATVVARLRAGWRGCGGQDRSLEPRAGMTRTSWLAPWLAEALDITRRYWSRAAMSGADAERQLWDWDRFRRHYLQAAEQIDFLLTPATAQTAPRHRTITGEDFIYTLPASLTGSPAAVVPVGTCADGLPIAVQLIGRPWEDQPLLKTARLLTPGSRPPPR